MGTILKFPGEKIGKARTKSKIWSALESHAAETKSVKFKAIIDAYDKYLDFGPISMTLKNPEGLPFTNEQIGLINGGVSIAIGPLVEKLRQAVLEIISLNIAVIDLETGNRNTPDGLKSPSVTQIRKPKKEMEMQVKSRNHVYETLPPFMDNRTLPVDQQLVLGLKVVTSPEQDAYFNQLGFIRETYALDKAQELVKEKTKDLVRSKFSFIKGLEIEGIGEKALDFNTLYEEGPPELVAWITRVIMSTTELSHAERKNFLPESDLV